MSVQVSDNPGAQQFEIAVDGEVVGFAQYRRSKSRGLIAFIHTEVDEGHEGEGLGGKLVSAAPDSAREQGLPSCRSAPSSAATSSATPTTLTSPNSLA